VTMVLYWFDFIWLQRDAIRV